jgi:aryl-phospho-beta-D-glucosidase BglC (GH1 family)
MKNCKNLGICKNVFVTMIASMVLMSQFSCGKDSNPAPPTVPPVTPPTTFVSAAAVIDSMGTGFNLGNTFDYALQSTTPASIYPIIDLYANAGMRHVRIPVTWMDGFSGNTLANASGSINFSHARFIQLKAVIDYAINKRMFVVLNTHHEHWLNNNYNGTAQYNNAFANLWTGIATHFKDYSHLLIFEVLNEPHGVFGDWSGGASPSSSAALALTRQINKVGYDAIRATAGLNTNRVVMVSANGMGNHNQLDDVYPSIASIPGSGSDRYLSFHVHTYDPWAFCGQTGSNASWPGSTSITNSLRTVSTYAKTLNVPVNYGEFGVGRDANAAERNSNIVREYYRTMRLTCLSEKMSPTVWDDRGWFGLVNSGGSSFIHNIVPSMMAP